MSVPRLRPVRAPESLAVLIRHPLLRYLTTGGASFLVDAGVLAALHGVAHVDLALATTIAFVTAFVFNFVMSRHWTFPTGQRAPTGQLTRFMITVVGNLVSTVVIVTGLTYLGVFYLVAKALATAINSIVNYFLYRYWIFQ